MRSARTAILVDGGFFLTRYQSLRGSRTPREAARALHAVCLEHLRKQERKRHQLYRIFYYDCPPLNKKAHNPITNRSIDFGKTPMASWRLEFLEELKKLRKVALRLGYLSEGTGHWVLRSERTLKDIISGRRQPSSLTDQDIKYDVRQKGVDMKLGLDIASLAFKQLVDQIILIAGDSDFVPAAKLARREGIDFILDPMWASIRDDLHEHIDGLCTVFEKPISARPIITGVVGTANLPDAIAPIANSGMSS
jgi:uncharacterized LabA/DUF88 family protein